MKGAGYTVLKTKIPSVSTKEKTTIHASHCYTTKMA